MKHVKFYHIWSELIGSYTHIFRYKLISPYCSIYASVKWVSNNSGNGLSPVRRRAITWINAGLLSIGLLGINFIHFSEIGIGILSFSFRKMHLKLSSAKMVAILSRGRWVKHAIRLRYSKNIILFLHLSYNQRALWAHPGRHCEPLVSILRECSQMSPGLRYQSTGKTHRFEDKIRVVDADNLPGERCRGHWSNYVRDLNASQSSDAWDQMSVIF